MGRNLDFHAKERVKGGLLMRTATGDLFRVLKHKPQVGLWFTEPWAYLVWVVSIIMLSSSRASLTLHDKLVFICFSIFCVLQSCVQHWLGLKFDKRNKSVLFFLNALSGGGFHKWHSFKLHGRLLVWMVWRLHSGRDWNQPKSRCKIWFCNTVV